MVYEFLGRCTSIFARLSPFEIGSTQTTTDGNFLASAGSTVGVQLSIPLASRNEEREHALKALEEHPVDGLN
jgi:hypothetical protein